MKPRPGAAFRIRRGKGSRGGAGDWEFAGRFRVRLSVFADAAGGERQAEQESDENHRNGHCFNDQDGVLRDRLPQLVINDVRCDDTADCEQEDDEGD